jgi:hypothetical protein
MCCVAFTQKKKEAHIMRQVDIYQISFHAFLFCLLVSLPSSLFLSQTPSHSVGLGKTPILILNLIIINWLHAVLALRYSHRPLRSLLLLWEMRIYLCACTPTHRYTHPHTRFAGGGWRGPTLVLHTHTRSLVSVCVCVSLPCSHFFW